jgi:hypothetical protein
MTPQELLKLGDIDAAIWAASRSEAARIVHAALVAGDITFDARREYVPVLWQSTDYPCRRLSYTTWLAWFRALHRADLPPAPIRAWRAQVGDELGLSWSYERGVAERFHNVNVARGYANARLLEGAIPVCAIVAHIPDPEHELVVDPQIWANVLASEVPVLGAVSATVHVIAANAAA